MDASKKKFFDWRIILSSIFITLLSLALPLLILQVYDRIIPNQSFGTTGLLVTGTLIAIFFEWILRNSRSFQETNLNIIGQAKIIKNCLKKNEDIGYTNESPQYLFKQILAASTKLSSTVTIDVFFMVIYFLIITYFGGLLIIVPIIFILIMMITDYYTKASIIDNNSKLLNNNIYLIKQIENSFDYISNTQQLVNENRIMRDHEKYTGEFIIQNIRNQKTSYQTMSLNNLYSQACLVFTAAYGIILVTQQKITIGILAACTLLVSRVIQPFKQISQHKIDSENYHQLNSLMSQYLDRKPEPTRPRYSLSYDGKALTVELNEKQTLTANFPSMIGIIGSDSNEEAFSLKSLALQLKENSQIQLLMNYISNDSPLYPDTLLQNMILGNMHYLETALYYADQLGLLEIIQSLKNGLDTDLSEHAGELSPGIKQRILIVRALTIKSNIIIFDGANDQLDHKGDNAFKNILITMKKSHLIFIKTLRPSILKMCDQSFNFTR